MIRSKIFLIAALFAFSLLSCSKRRPEPVGPAPIILARAGDRDITLDDFIRRAEYTIRPSYVKGNTYIHKKMVLNSIIAEKLFALEAGPDNDLAHHPGFINFIRGRTEQAMRKHLFQAEGLQKVELDSAEIANAYRYAGRKVRVAYFSVPTAEMAQRIEQRLQSGEADFETIYANMTGGEGELPEREVEWSEEGNERIHQQLFRDSLRVGQTFPPIEAEAGLFTAIKVLGWTDQPAVSEAQKHQRWADVSERLRREKAYGLYVQFASRVMRGKEVQFVEQTLMQLADKMLPLYFLTDEIRQQAFNEKFWANKEAELPFEGVPEEIMDAPLLRIEGDVWRVRDLQDEIARHPLVFRKQRMSRAEFPRQFQLAIVDLIRDKYLTRVAYDRGYEKIESVIRTKQMWSDHLVSLFHRDQVLNQHGITREQFATGYLEIIEQVMNDYVDSLQVKYSDRIEINTDVFEKIRLTRIDMFVTEKNVPYPVRVPSFPILTTDKWLDYGRKMENEQTE